jgi:N6-L-threonylcarbamoyladenine synthase
VVDVLVTKTIALAKEQGVSQILLAGGVAANKVLRQQLTENSPMPVSIPPFIFCTDNAAMIAACAYYRFKAGHTDGPDMDAIPGLKLA